METNIERDGRLEKVRKLRELGENPFKNGYTAKNEAQNLHQTYGEFEATRFENEKVNVSIAGRIILLRSFGKAAFITLQDKTGRIQAYVSKADLSEKEFETFKHYVDVGDIVCLEGNLFKTKTGELTIHAHKFVLLTKAVRSLPEKFHGLTDVETKYRQRYVDLIVNQESREVFIKRFKIISSIRNFLAKKGFYEVETPVLNTTQGGAAARPFITHHNALDMQLFMRIAPELYLKRLIVGGFDKVFELGRVFRNEGIDIKHNPEFSLLEFYWAYATFEDLMDMTEEMLNCVLMDVVGSDEIVYQGKNISFKGPWKRISVADSIVEYAGADAETVADHKKLSAWAESKGIHLSKPHSYGHVLMDIFDEKVESQLINPTFITHYPTVVSPLARRNEKNPEVTDRFELFIYGMEAANAFSELNDPVDQLERFEEQALAKAQGDDEACDVDHDYVRALEYGMPPTAGEGIGIDRLVMLLTDSASIRDVLLFPHMRPE